MVHCFECMNELPYKCTCRVSEETKMRRYFEAAIREAQLCLAILRGHRPRGKLGPRVYEASGVEKYFGSFGIRFVLGCADWRRHGTFVLLDREGKPLYRYTMEGLGVAGLGPRKVIDLVVRVGGIEAVEHPGEGGGTSSASPPKSYKKGLSK